MKQNAFTECISHSCILSLYPISFNLIARCGHQLNLQPFSSAEILHGKKNNVSVMMSILEEERDTLM